MQHDSKAKRRYMREVLSRLEKGPMPEEESRQFTEWLKDRDNFAIYMQDLHDKEVAEGCAFWVVVIVAMAFPVFASWQLGKIFFRGSWQMGALCVGAYMLALIAIYVLRPRGIWPFRKPKDLQ